MPWDHTTPTGMAPVSVKAGTTANARRIHAGATTTTAAPTLASHGYATGAFRYLHIDIKLTGGTNATFKLWRWNQVSGIWKLDSRMGVNGTLTISTADTSNNPYGAIIETAFSERCYLQIAAVSGPPTIDAWVGGV